MVFSESLFLAVHGRGMREVIVLTDEKMPHFHLGFTTRIQENCSVVVDAPNVDTVICPLGVTRTLHGTQCRMRVRVCESSRHAEESLAEFDATPHDVCINRDDELDPGEIVECEFEDFPAQ